MVPASTARGRQDGPQGRRDVRQVTRGRTQGINWKAVPALVAGAALAALSWRFLAPALALTAGAAALAFLLSPLCRKLEGALGAGLAATACLLGLLILLAAVLCLLAPALIRQVADLAAALPAALQTLRGLGGKLGAWMQSVGLDGLQLPALDMGNLGNGILHFAAGTVSFASGVANAISQLSMAAVLSAFLLIDRKNLLLRLELCVPLRLRATAVRMGAAAGREVRLYLRAQATVSLAVGALSALGLWLAGVRSALALGLLVGLFNLIPYFGPVLGAVPALAAALASGWQTALFAAIVLIIVQQLDGLLISPRVMGALTGLSPAAVLVGVFAGGCALGVAGMLLALPAMMAFRTCVRVFVQQGENI